MSKCGNKLQNDSIQAASKQTANCNLSEVTKYFITKFSDYSHNMCSSIYFIKFMKF